MSMTWHPKDVRNRPTRAAAAELGARAGIGFAEVGVTQGAPTFGANGNGDVGCRTLETIQKCGFMSVYGCLSWWVCGSAWFRCVFVFRETCCICRYNFYILCCTVWYSCYMRQELFNNCDDDRSGFIEWPVTWCWNIWGTLSFGLG